MIADDAEASRIPELKFTPGVGVMDQVVQQLTRLILPAFDHPDHVSELFADHISLALGSHIARTYGGMRSVVAPRQGGLAAWQERRAKELMSANLRGNFSSADLATECLLSAGHFARAFRHSTGLSPHQWLIQCRIEKAACTTARGQTLARRDCARVRLCRSKPLHKSLYAPTWYQPGRLAAATGNCTETIKYERARLVRSCTSGSFRFEETKDDFFAQERLGLAR